MRKWSNFPRFPGLALSAIGLSVLLLSGCVTVPDDIRGTTDTPQMNLQVVQGAPQLYVGQESRFGGKVVGITNEKNKTRLEIATMPLDDSARPILGAASLGRIHAYVNGFVDPVDFKGQLVTVVGPITGAEDGTIGETSYKFVTVNVNSFKRWHLTQQVVMPPQPMGPWGWGYGGPYDPRWGRGYGPGWGPGWYDTQPARVETVVTE
ncbi:Slp family lipoprotein [Ewingella americana]|jgi:outer membrane lipoprotein|uniref:Slp family lipoprotein n=1 Tax=Ewingella americana TaxID=41202 RepID=A0A502GCZ1_9GAMM|nr:Slp family lipoprotein [Ewingella americana]TPG59368.1 Slp family lipoprotein [Ewingella americana]